MNSIRQKCRPKHQVLILKCYPPHQKNAVELKPNSSELSYLLYYASTRRSKLQKVGAFLEKKTESDVWRNRIGNVQVTLQIVKALVDKCARDLPLFARSVLQILATILHSQDITLLEASTPTFEAFCTHYDVAQFAADLAQNAQYDEIIRLYTSYASKETPFPSKTPISVPMAVRYRAAGLEAIKSLVSADSFAADNGAKLQVVMPVILQNIYSESTSYISRLQMRENAKQEYEKEQSTYRRRQSIAIPRSDSPGEIDASVATGTTADFDEKANEDVGVLALQSLRQIFDAETPAQLRLATQDALSFIVKHSKKPASAEGGKSYQRNDWPAELFESICRWTPVQNRYIVLVAATDMLTKSPIVEEDLGNQFTLTSVIGSLLRSSITFIGLSVNDVLIGFIQHILLLLQLGGQNSGLRPHRQQTEPFGLLKTPQSADHDTSSASAEPEIVKTPSPIRMQLLEELQNAIGDLATHVYYADQISEMVAALLLRLKPPIPVMPTTASAIEDPSAAAEAIAESAQLKEKTQTDDFFSFDTARVIALRAVKKILVTANSRKKDGGSASGRNRVPVSTWDGTQWLLCDPDGRVRKAYVDALLTWMSLELDKSNLRVAEEQPRKSKTSKQDAHLSNGSAIARRALSNASKTNRINLRARSSFMQLLHLAVYENALTHANSEPDMLLLHLLLVSLIQKLGVNSVRHGLPMVLRLQEDITRVENPATKDAIGSLVHGYLWGLSEFFDFDTTSTGRIIHDEISRRTQIGLWLPTIRVPPVRLDLIATPSSQPVQPRPVTEAMLTHSLRPFEAHAEMVGCISEAYSGSLLSPPSSPPLSPGLRPRSAHSRSNSTVKRQPSYMPAPSERQLPSFVKEQMLSQWTKESCISEADKVDGKAQSLSGSKTGSGSGRHLSANGTGNPAVPNPRSSDLDVSQDNNQTAGISALAAYRLTSNGDESPASGSTKESVVRVADLKKILETGVDSRQLPRPMSERSDVASDSMVSAEADISSIN